jgi:hypothetical protein
MFGRACGHAGTWFPFARTAGELAAFRSDRHRACRDGLRSRSRPVDVKPECLAFVSARHVPASHAVATELTIRTSISGRPMTL